MLFDFGTITSRAKRPHLCLIYNDEIQQEFVGVDNYVFGMLNDLQTYKHEMLLTAHNSDYDCIFIFEYLQNVKPIVKSNRCFTYKGDIL